MLTKEKGTKEEKKKKRKERKERKTGSRRVENAAWPKKQGMDFSICVTLYCLIYTNKDPLGDFFLNALYSIVYPILQIMLYISSRKKKNSVVCVCVCLQHHSKQINLCNAAFSMKFHIKCAGFACMRSMRLYEA